MSSLRRLAQKDPEEAATATFNIRPYYKKSGQIYVYGKRNKPIVDAAHLAPAGQLVDYVDLKVGETGRIHGRMEDYERNCAGETIMWAYYYQTDNVVLLERLVHLTLIARGAKRVPYPCVGCGVKHRELFSEFAAGSFEGIADIIETWLIRLGEPIVKVYL